MERLLTFAKITVTLSVLNFGLLVAAVVVLLADPCYVQPSSTAP